MSPHQADSRFPLLLLGGARSGKSRLAEQIALASGWPVTVIATARASDAEMAARIAQHQADRPAGWQTVEAPLALADAIRQASQVGQLVLVDCLTLWLANQLFAVEGQALPEVGPAPLPAHYLAARAELLESLDAAASPVLLVSNEVGLGITPLGAGTRCFLDEAGRLNQHLAARCARVAFVAAGLPLWLKGQA